MNNKYPWLYRKKNINYLIGILINAHSIMGLWLLAISYLFNNEQTLFINISFIKNGTTRKHL